ncbi:MAG: zinc ribbon domain-containing protein [Desulfobacterales bacterium]|nr:MAG: zinc ribbon domain-containing protein [Desulfobacterales bacterium]
MVTDASDSGSLDGHGGRSLQCPGCQVCNSGDAVFCDECGSRLESSCAGCGQTNRLGAKFCKKCGQPLRRAAAAPGPADTARFASPDYYTPKHGVFHRVKALIAQQQAGFDFTPQRWCWPPDNPWNNGMSQIRLRRGGKMGYWGSKSKAPTRKNETGGLFNIFDL